MARRVLLLGATGTIGRATLASLRAAGCEPTCAVRRRSDGTLPQLDGARVVDAADLAGALADGPVDAVVSCMASRTGVAADAWAVDHRAHLEVLALAEAAGASHFVLTSAICVQKPKLEFQRAKLAFEAALAASGLRYSIVRPTAFFKSLSGQIERVRAGRGFLIFGDGRLTACKPIADEDLGDYLTGCLFDPERWNRILPIGGPGPAITPREQGEALFELTGRSPRFRSVPPAMLDVIAAGLGAAARLVPPLASKAELARIGRYYATQSMLVWDAAAGRYDAEATPQFGTRTLFDHYRAVLAGEASVERGDHAVF